MTRRQIAKRARLEARILRSRALHAIGEARQWQSGAARGPQVTLLVLGCQRSGTTLATRLLDVDPGAKVYPEHSALSWKDRRDGLRLAPPECIAERIARSRFPLVVLKPLVESQNALALLEQLPRARGLWMFRQWRDVARSNLQRFGKGKGIANLRSVFERRPNDWRSEGVSTPVHEVVSEHFSDSMNPYDAAALFWWARNALYFELGLDADRRVRTCRYEELVTDSTRILGRLYHWLGRPLPASTSLPTVSTASIGSGSTIEFSPVVSVLCDELLGRIVEAHEKGSACG